MEIGHSQKLLAYTCHTPMCSHIPGIFLQAEKCAWDEATHGVKLGLPNRSFMPVVTLYKYVYMYVWPDCGAKFDFLHCRYCHNISLFPPQPSKVNYESGSETEKEIIQSQKEEQIPLVTADQEKGMPVIQLVSLLSLLVHVYMVRFY